MTLNKIFTESVILNNCRFRPQDLIKADVSAAGVNFECLYEDSYPEEAIPSDPTSTAPDDNSAANDAANGDANDLSFSSFDYIHAYATLPFLVFHISLILCLYASGRQDPTYREGFFVLFMILSVADAIVVFHVSVMTL